MIEGFSVGHHTSRRPGWLTGTTVVLAEAGAVGGVDVRGGGPGTRETDLLAPTAMVDRVHAVVLTGGSAYGLSAVDGVVRGLEDRGIGFPVATPQASITTAVVPIVPAAVIFDLGRGGDVGTRPDPAFGRSALYAAFRAADQSGTLPACGNVGAGTGAVCGGLKGGFGYAEAPVGRHRIGAAMVVNAVGSAVDPATGRLWADIVGDLRDPTQAERSALAEQRRLAAPSLNTTIGVVMTDADLTKARAAKVAQVAHDGLARAIRPVHSMADGDTIFCLASGRVPAAGDPATGWAEFDALLSAAADVVTAACLTAVVSASSVGPWRAYGDLVHLAA